jgi:ABC-2 type transport system permease protein
MRDRLLNEQWVAFCTIVTKEVRRFLRIWMQTLLPPAITMSLYFVIFGSLIGSRVGKMGGYDYMQYIAPGLIMMSVIQNSYSNVVSSFFGTKFHRSIEEMMVSPMSSFVVLAGFCIGGVARGLCVGIIVTCVSLFFTNLHVAHLGVMLLVVVLTALLFSLGGFLNALFAKSFDDISIIPTFVLTPLTYLGGVFYSLELLPSFWRHLTLVNPIVYMVNTFRYGILGVSDVSVTGSVFAIIGFTLGLFLLAWYLFHRGIGVRS